MTFNSGIDCGPYLVAFSLEICRCITGCADTWASSFYTSTEPTAERGTQEYPDEASSSGGQSV